MSAEKANQLPATALAFVGDAVFTLYVRYHLAALHDFKTGELTRRAAKTVSAVFQSKILDFIEPELTESELSIVKRCRNAHTNNSAKNASAREYHRATGLEGLLGYLYLTGSNVRLDEILSLIGKQTVEGDSVIIN